MNKLKYIWIVYLKPIFHKHKWNKYLAQPDRCSICRKIRLNK